MTNPHPAAPPQLPPKEVFPGIWYISAEVVMGIPLGLKVRFSRNMVAVLQPDGWVLINPVRLTDEAEAMLLEKGPFKHAVRLGTFHGRDDAWYVDQHGTELWGVEGRQSYDSPAFTQTITEDGPFPVAGAQVVVYQQARLAECVVCLPEHQLLVTCDSVQHYENDPMIDTLGKLVMRAMGFFTPCVIGPVWLKEVTPRDGSLLPDFERVLALDFDNLIGGHGTPKIGGAKAALAANVDKLR